MSTYTPIASVTLSSTQSTVTFSNIPQTYTDLVLVTSTQLASSLTAITCRLNGDTSALYSSTRLYGNDLNVSTSDRFTNQTFGSIGFTSSTNFVTGIFQFLNYGNATTFKTMLGRSTINDNGGYIFAYVSVWRNTSAVTTLTLGTESGTSWNAGSTFNLYGISANDAVTPKASGGNIVVSDGTYWYHAFTSSGIFTPTAPLTADILTIAGGGSGGGNLSGGGGAGGLVYLSSQSISVASAVTVGAGGAQKLTGGEGNNGSNSQFASLTAAIGGGGGGSINGSANGKNGGSGGGAYFGGSVGTAQSGQGNNGGGAGQANGAGGGGGAGASGSSGGSYSGGNGGAGVNTYSSWASATQTGVSGFYAGGGGGGGDSSNGSGGSGGGGAAGNNGTAGTANTGGGGGGSRQVGSTRWGGAGGSGIVIVRYAV
jgi:hypothetical protein